MSPAAMSPITRILGICNLTCAWENPTESLPSIRTMMDRRDLVSGTMGRAINQTLTSGPQGPAERSMRPWESVRRHGQTRADSHDRMDH